MLQQYLEYRDGFRQFYFTLGAFVESENEADVQQLGGKTKQKSDGIISCGVRKLFKLGKASILPRGAPGRLPTAFGCLSSAAEQYQLAVIAELAAKKLLAQKLNRKIARQKSEKYESPIVQYLVKHGYLAQGEKLVKKAMSEFFAQHKELMKSHILLPLRTVKQW